ncbi:heavy metal-associated isoprenylated plant protein 6-like [Solanum stenotomum]|uniref:heavy metal-associated isoprenylated plant protein 6-like n=1 Tax=Solanum stenotomum TaxID=172797 RepID=UPI0020D115F4|nr:heavy metal-associated isoprenylated plant protein 6-like [Solanum stenotomum]
MHTSIYFHESYTLFTPHKIHFLQVSTMGGEKTAIMVLKVDLQCSNCYKKVKKILCKFPQIRDQVYDEKGNTVTITVVCCNPEKLRDKLCSKGFGVIISIEIKDPKKPTEPINPNGVTIEKPAKSEKPKVVIIEKPEVVIIEKPKELKKPEEVPEPKLVALIMPMLIQEYPQLPHGYCCGECHQGQTGGPCYQGYGRQPRPGPYGYGRGCYVSRCDQYLNDENVNGCSIT